MKYLIFLLSILPLYGLTINYNTAQENKKPYGMLHIRHDKPFACKVSELELGKKRYTCTFENSLVNPPTPKRTPLMDISFLQRESEFDIIVTPFFNSRLLNMDVNLYDSKEVPLMSNENASHWVILIYESLPFAQQEVEDGINFPVYYPELKRPSVGALDLNGAPIEYVRSRDINIYLDIKKAYEAKRYEAVLEDAQEAMMLYPQTIFKDEFALYRLRAMDKLLDDDERNTLLEIDYDDIVNEGKSWIKSFPSDEHIPEVLYYIAKSYLKLGFSSDANYFLDILITEHPNNYFTKKGILIYADSLYNGTKQIEALRLYTDVLYSAKDLDIASEAAIRLAQYSIDAGQIQEAKEFLVKVLNANADFLRKDRDQAYEMAQKLAYNGLEDIAAQIAQTILKGQTKADLRYEELLKDTGLWYAQAKNISKADEYLNRYKREFSSGAFIDEVQEGLDRLFFDLNETNSTKLEEYYNTLLQRYDNEIAQRAVVEKIKLYTKEGMYEKALSLDDFIRQMDDGELKSEGLEALSKAALLKANNDLLEDNCKDAVGLIERYKIADSLKDKKKVFECFYRLSRYDEAIKEAKNHIQVRNLRERLSWMQDLSKALFKNENYRELIALSDDIYSLGILVKNPSSKSILQKKALALIALKRYDEALSVVDQIQEELPNEYGNIEVYSALVDYAKTIGSDLMIDKFATLAINLQNSNQVYTYSPEIDYLAISAKERLGKMDEALEIAQKLPNNLQNATKRIQALYKLGELYYKLDKLTEAREVFEQCANMEVESPWKKMCQEHIAITEN